MNLNEIDLNLFTIFDVIYTERNLTKAGKVLGITQPAVSNALSRLRATFDDHLFTRTANGMMPTPVAQNVITEVRQALTLLRVSVREGHNFEAKTATKRFNISMRDIFEVTFLPGLLTAFREEAPSIRLHSCYTYPNELIHNLSSGYLDLAIETSISVPQNLHHVKIHEVPFVCVARNDHPILKDQITLQQYVEAEHIHITNGKEDTTHLDSALTQQGISRNIIFTGHSYFVTSLLILQTNAVLTIPETLAERYAAYLDIQVLPLPIEVAPLETYMYWHDNVHEDPANKWLRGKLLESTGNKSNNNYSAAASSYKKAAKVATARF